MIGIERAPEDISLECLDRCGRRHGLLSKGARRGQGL